MKLVPLAIRWRWSWLVWNTRLNGWRDTLHWMTHPCPNCGGSGWHLDPIVGCECVGNIYLTHQLNDVGTEDCSGAEEESVEDDSNTRKLTLRWPYFQNLTDHQTVYGHCPWCMKPSNVDEDVGEGY